MRYIGVSLVVIVALLLSSAAAAQDGADPIGHIYIPAIQLDRVVQAVPLVDRTYHLSTLEDGVAWLEGTAWISHDWARIVLAGHTPGAFDELTLLRPGDQVIVWDAHAVEVYVVQFLRIVPATDIRWLMPTPDETLTLLTCAGELRLVVHATKHDD